MSHRPNELAELFPEHAAKIPDLSRRNAHFHRLEEEYHDLNRQIHRVETDIEPMDDRQVEAMKKARLALLDAIHLMLHQDA